MTSGCPTDNEIAEHAADPSRSAAVARHLEACEACAMAFAAVVTAGDASARPDAPTEESGGAPRSSATLPRGANVGRYVVIETVGRGAMGTVYAAYDPELDRKIALKVLRADLGRGPGAAALRERLVREARVMARLSHPEVITVHDAGTFGDQVFIAMEFVGGGTLGAFLAARARPVREVLDVFLRAGRGLAAAHAAGLVHRDFKPENVLVGEGGRVRVTDFGLARAEALPPIEDAPASKRAEPADAHLTATGAVVGTPAYMAPEQHRGERADARSDQYAFCVALYRALYGEPPFAGATAAELAREAARGQVREAPKGSRVPAWVRRALLRGLSPAPEARYPSMDALLADLARDPAAARRRRLLGVGVAALVGAAAAVGWGVRARQAPACRGGDEQLAGVWDAGRKADVRRAFLATGLPHADQAFTTAALRIGLWASAFSEGHRRACLAHARGEESDDLLARRTACLARRLEGGRAIVDVWARADAKTVERAVQASEALPRVEECADTAALLASIPPPRKEDAPRVEAVRRRLDEVYALEMAGKLQEALAASDAIEGEVRAIGYAHLTATAALRRGYVEGDLDRTKEGEEALFEAAVSAEAAHDDDQAARAWTQLVGTWTKQGNKVDARRAAAVAAAHVERLGGSEVRTADLENALVQIALAEGKLDEAMEHAQRDLAYRERMEPGTTSLAIAHDGVGFVAARAGNYRLAETELRTAVRMYEAMLGAGHPSALNARNTLAVCLHREGRTDEAVAEILDVIAKEAQVYGADSATAAQRTGNLGGMLIDAGRFEEAEPYVRRALALEEKAHGAESPEAAMAHVNLAGLHYGLRRYEEALSEARRALAIDEKLLGPDDAETGQVHVNLGAILLSLGKAEEALDEDRRGLAVLSKALGPDHPMVSLAYGNVGDDLRQLRRLPEAIAAYERAVAVREKAVGPDHPGLADPLAGMGKTLLAQGAVDRAVTALERAVELREKGDPAALADAEIALAEALWKRGDKDRARAQAEAAAADDARAGARAAADLSAARAWLAAHR